MGKGWISLHRQIQNHWVWKDKPFSKGQAWIDLILLANHENKKVMIGNTLIPVKRGGFITSEVKLADRWGWSRKKVRGFLKSLEEDLMVVKKSTTRYTAITIENYSIYQDVGTTKKQQKNINGTSTEHQRNTNNNDNNDNNDNNINSIAHEKKQTIDYTPEFETFWKNYPNKYGKKNTFKYWLKLIKKYTADELIQTAKNYSKDTFNTEKRFIKRGYNFFGHGTYEDYLPKNYKTEDITTWNPRA